MRDIRRAWLWSFTICAILILVYTVACAPVAKPGTTVYTVPTQAPSKPEVFDDVSRGVVCYLWGAQLSCVKYGGG